jgi:3-oxoacyl-[acyl-carrier-protein] synthase-1
VLTGDEARLHFHLDALQLGGARVARRVLRPALEDGDPDDELFVPEGADGLEGFLEDFVLPLREELDLPLDERLVRGVGKGHAGAATAMQRALQELESGRLERVLLVAADSLLDPTALQWLAEESRLKTDDLPVGLQPGEAGACLLVERTPSAQHRGAKPLARVS